MSRYLDHLASMPIEELQQFREHQRKRDREYWRIRKQNESPEQTEKRRTKQRDSRRAMFDRNPTYYRDYAFKKHHGVTREKADQLSADQDGKCAICKDVPSGKSTASRLHVDHCHTTGKVRGMLCVRCNTSLGLMRDNPVILEAAIQYLLPK